jgi:uncharacterized protein YaaW (UPF0174 family)
MVMAYRKDPDLEFLASCDNDDLGILVDLLTRDKDGEVRWTEELTDSEEFKQYYPDHKKYWELIAAEIQTFGANTFSTIIRGGKGVLYREVLTDACDKMKVNYNKKSSISQIEVNMLMKILTDSLNDMSPQELKEAVEMLNLPTGNNYTKEAVLIAMQIAIKQSGFFAYRAAVIIANAVAKALIGRGLTFATNAMLTRAISVFAGPVGWVIAGLWTLFDVAGPAYRITIPAVIQVAYMRLKKQYENS